MKVIVITGPTAVGKTSISLKIASIFKTEIINGDAYQIYKGMDVGTSKVTKEEQQLIKHHMLDIIPPTKEFSIYDYQQMGRKVLADFKEKQMLPIIVGGSGLYLDALIYDYKLNAKKRDYNTEEKYANYSNHDLHKLLNDKNPTLAATIHENNRKRVLRAIERNESEVNTDEATNYNAIEHPLYDVLFIYLTDSREKLYDRINKRVSKMINEGLLAEVESFFPDKLSTQARSAIGYKELYEYLEGDISLDEAIELIKKNTRHYAKRQETWFRKHPNTIKVMIDTNDLNNTISEIESIINNFLKA